MSEERKVICRCGKEMALQEAEGIMPAYRFIASYHCGCGWNSPVRDGTTREEAAEEACAAATRRPENRPLTLPELFDLEDDDAAWVVAENGKIYAMGAECAQEWASEEHCLFFARKPTPEDIEAARAGKEGQNRGND